MKLQKEILFNYKTYIKQKFTKFELLDILGNKFVFEEKAIQEILDSELMVYFQEYHDWILKAIENLKDWIERAFYTKQYPIENANYFFTYFYNEKSVVEVLSNIKSKDTQFDSMWDFYVRILKELNYDL